MNARQRVKKLKKEIDTLKSDNDLMSNIISDSPAMQELYDAYNKPKFVTHTTMQFQEFRARRMVPNHITDATGLMPIYITDVEGVIEHTKQALAQDLFEGIKENITYEVDDKDMIPIITASIFIGRRE